MPRQLVSLIIQKFDSADHVAPIIERFVKLFTKTEFNVRENT